MSHLELLRRIYQEEVPFHRFLGLEVISAQDGLARIEFSFKPDLVGNFRLQALHGGVIASLMDIVGSAAVLSLFQDRPPPQGMGTIDLRVDYLRPARGRRFAALAEVVRPGRSVTVTSARLLNDREQLLAMATVVFRLSEREVDHDLSDWLGGD